MLPPLKWVSSPNFNSRHGTCVDQVIIHRCEGTYQGSIAYFETTTSQVSAHFLVAEDGSEVTQMVHLSDRAWHACAANSRSVGIEMAGYEAKGYDHNLLPTSAALAAYLCHYLQIPVRHARGGVGPGIESHWGLGVAGGHHFDPEPKAEWIDSVFMPLVQAAYNKAAFDPNWLHHFDGSMTPCSLTPPGG